jgi:hypothetical protein
MNQRDLEDRLRQIAWPPPSPELRNRVLSTAVTGQPITWSDRMWFSRAWRLAAAGAALAIVVLDQVSGAPGSTPLSTTPQTLAEAQAVDDAGREMGLPADVAASLARRVLSEVPRTREQPPSTSELLQELTREGGGD